MVDKCPNALSISSGHIKSRNKLELSTISPGPVFTQTRQHSLHAITAITRVSLLCPNIAMKWSFAIYVNSKFISEMISPCVVKYWTPLILPTWCRDCPHKICTWLDCSGDLRPSGRIEGSLCRTWVGVFCIFSFWKRHLCVYMFSM